MRNEKETVLDLLIHPRAGDNFDRKQSEKELLEAITNKNEQLHILHQINTRLGHELSLLQRKLGINPQAILQQLQKIGDISVAYHGELQQMQYLDQLLLSYDETILKQKKIIAMLYSQLEDFQKRSETLVRENECLVEENKSKCKKILEIYHRGYPEQNLTLAYNRLQRETDQERNDILKQQTEEVLTAYNNLLLYSQELEKELEQQKTSSKRYFQSLKKQSEELKEALLSVDNLLKVKEFLQKTVSKLGQENIALQTLKTEGQARVTKQESEIKSLRNQLFTQKKMSCEEIQRIASQLQSFKSESESGQRRERQIFNRNIVLEKEVESAKQQIRNLKRESEKSKSELQQTLKMCEAYQSKIAIQARKQGALAESFDRNKQKLDSVILERDRMMLKVQTLEKMMQDMNIKHREDQAKIRQNYDRMLAQLQERIKIAEEEKQEAESVFLESELSLKNQIDKLGRENLLLRQENLKFMENIHVNTGSQIINKLKEYEAKNQSLMKLLAQKQKQLKDQQTRHQEALHDLDIELKNINRLLEKEKIASTQYLKEMTQERSRANILTNQKDCLQQEIKRLKKSHEHKSGLINDDREFRIHELQTRLDESMKKEKEIKEKALAMFQKYDETEQNLKGHYQKIVVELEAEIAKLRRKNEKLKSKKYQ